MAEIILQVPTDRASDVTEFTSDDIVSRQSITTREAAVLGLDGDHLYVRVSGSDEGIRHAKLLAEARKLGEILPADKAAKVASAIDKQDDAAAEGMGLIDF